MTKDEALKIAIEWLDNQQLGYSGHSVRKACQEALVEQPTNMVTVPLDKLEDMQRRLKATQEPVYTNGDRTMTMKDRNFTSEGNGYIQDNNFDFDAGLRIDGDFVDAERDQYAQMICSALNTQQPTQEPVAWQALCGDKHYAYGTAEMDLKGYHSDFWQRPLYTHPPKQWQGLSDKEIGTLTVFDGLHHVETPLLAKFIRAIEAKLREKNG